MNEELQFTSESHRNGFFDRIVIPENPLDDCWEWTNPDESGAGYGRYVVNGRLMCSHRISAAYFKQVDLFDKEVCHRCDNRKCVNPHHLVVADHKWNMLDCSNKDRIAFGDYNGNSKLTDKQAIQAILDIDEGKLTFEEIGNKFGVSKVSISNIHKGATWVRMVNEILPNGFRKINRRNKKLSDNDVEKIKELLAEGKMKQLHIAKMFNVGCSAIGDIKHGKR